MGERVGNRVGIGPAAGVGGGGVGTATMLPVFSAGTSAAVSCAARQSLKGCIGGSHVSRFGHAARPIAASSLRTCVRSKTPGPSE